MATEKEEYVEIFLSYAHEDKQLCNKLKEQLSILERQKLISSWHDGLLQVGKEWNSELRHHLYTAQIILLLISPAYMASETNLYYNSVIPNHNLNPHQTKKTTTN